MRFSWRAFAAAVAACLAAAALAAPRASQAIPAAVNAVLATLSADRLMAHIRVLSADKFDGRGPGTTGEQLSIAYIGDQFRGIGLAPGNLDGNYLQNVPMEGITPVPGSVKLGFAGAGSEFNPRFGDDYIAWTKRLVEESAAQGELVFAGYEIQAPEFRWDDIKGANLKGKILLVLVNNPPFRTIAGKQAMTYYGRWAYKYEEAARLGAAGCLIIHETGAAGYPWAVVRGSWTGEQFTLANPNRNMDREPFEGWVTQETAGRLFQMGGKNLATLEAAAQRRDFKPVPLGVTARLGLRNTLRAVQSHNVIGRIDGSDPNLRNQYVIYTAHWDHLGDHSGQIYHGAVDNASGVAALIEIARAYKALPKPPSRTMIFLSVTAEEQGLLGSEYYAEHPLYPLARTAADINMDALNVWGPTRDIVSIGMGESTLDNTVAASARALGRIVRPDPEPEKGFFFRSDHFNFVKAGVPAFDPDSGVDYSGKPAGYGDKVRASYTANNYHKPTDVIYPDWNLAGLVDDCKLYFLVGYNVAENAAMPAWNPGSEFRAARMKSIATAGKSR
ncbi:MAG TPA: M20/M25/M40 family metallo-hydrolase [Candidatus Acidoferrales bacterium]|nr:M20/M25/M40 family metallo-hydrolase [Candidatus Acidoferrales bacterium]